MGAPMFRLALLLLLLAGCVPRPRHELVRVQLEATRTALSAQDATCRDDLAQRDATVAALEAGRVEGRLRAEEQAARIASLEEVVAELEGQRATWAAQIPACDPEGAPLFPREVDEIAAALRAWDASRVAEQHAAGRREAFVAAFAGLVEEGFAEVDTDGRALVLRLPTAKLFNEGEVILSPRGEAMVREAAAALGSLPGERVEIRGHTDDRPYHSVEHGSNWELAFDRAMVVLRALEEHGVAQPLAASSFGGTQPIADNETPEGRKRNQRIELRLRPD